MPNYSFLNSLRSAQDHEYTRAKVDSSHEIPDSWIYSLPRLFAILAGVFLAFIFSTSDALDQYLSIQPIVQSKGLTLDDIADASGLLTMLASFLITYRIQTGESFFKVLSNQRNLTRWRDPVKKNRFTFTSLILLLVALMLNASVYALVSTDYLKGSERSINVSHASWDLNVPPAQKTFFYEKIQPHLPDIPHLEKFLERPKPKGAEVLIKITVTRGQEKPLVSSIRVSGCLNHRQVIADKWLRSRSSGSPVKADFLLTPSGRPFLVKVTDIAQEGVCAKPLPILSQSIMGTLVHMVVSELKPPFLMNLPPI